MKQRPPLQCFNLNMMNLEKYNHKQNLELSRTLEW